MLPQAQNAVEIVCASVILLAMVKGFPNEESHPNPRWWLLPAIFMAELGIVGFTVLLTLALHG